MSDISSAPPTHLRDGETSETRFRVEGMDCGSCAAKIETALGRMEQVAAVTVSLSGGLVTVEHGPGLDDAAVLRTISSLGFRPARLEETPAMSCCSGCAGDTPASAPAAERPWWFSGRLILLLVCGVALALVHALLWLVPGMPDWIMVVPLALGGLPVARRAVVAARLGTPFSIEMLMSVAVVGAVVIGAWDEAALVVFLFLLGEALEGVAAARARAGIRGLTELLPKQALRQEGEQWRLVEASQLRPGDVILVRPGDRLAADGTVIDGNGGIDEAPVSGESVPVAKQNGDSVFAGTINLDGVLTVRVQGDGGDNTITRIARLVEHAQQAKAPFARFVERFARWYTPAVVVFAALVMVVPPVFDGGDWRQWFYRGLALLLIGCPCALVISTPAAIAAALAAGARRGVLLKGGAVLERLAGVTMVAFDKTGTLTVGRPQVTTVHAPVGDETAWLAVAAGICTGSSHPLAQAVVARAAADGVVATVIQAPFAVPGQGIGGAWQGQPVFFGAVSAVTAQGAVPADWSAMAAEAAADDQTVSVLMVGARVVLVVGLRDGLRADAQSGIDRLRALRIEPAMLTGDLRPVAEAVGRRLGLAVHSELLPADKLDLVRNWQRQGAVVAKVGDGINDAPALAAADIGIAMGGGSEIALETADAALLHGRVGDVAAAVVLARGAMTNIRQNVALALGLKGVFLLTTLLGVTGLWPAVLADTGATVLVTVNALRMLRFKVK